MGSQTTKAALDALFANNSSGDITPARLRDLVESCVPSSALMRFASDEVAIAAASTPVKATNVTTLESSNRFTMPIDNRLTYGGAAAVTAAITAALSLSCGTADQEAEVGVALNGALIASSVQRVTLVAADALHQLVLQCDVDLENADYLEVFVANNTSDEDITIDHGSLRAAAFLT